MFLPVTKLMQWIFFDRRHIIRKHFWTLIMPHIELSSWESAISYEGKKAIPSLPRQLSDLKVPSLILYMVFSALILSIVLRKEFMLQYLMQDLKSLSKLLQDFIISNTSYRKVLLLVDSQTATFAICSHKKRSSVLVDEVTNSSNLYPMDWNLCLATGFLAIVLALVWESRHSCIAWL